MDIGYKSNNSGAQSCAHRCQPSHLVSLHSLHKEVRNPKGKEEIPGSLLFLPCVLLQVKELKDV